MLEEIVNQIAEGYTLIGDAVTRALIMLVGSFGLELPDWGARLSMLSMTALLVWRFQKMVPKLIMACVVIIAASILLGFA